MNACERYETMISALLDGELSERDKAELSAHIVGCERCSALAAAFAAASGALAEDFEEPPAGLHDAVMEKVGAAAKVRRGQSRFMRLRPVIAAAACIAVVVITLFAANHGIRGAENTGAASGSNVEALDTPAYAGGGATADTPAYAGGGATADAPADAGGESGGAEPMEIPASAPAPAGDGAAAETRSITDAMDAAAPEEAAEDSTAVATEAENDAEAPAGLPTLEVEAVAAADEGSFTATVVDDPGGYFAPGTSLTVLSDEAASPPPGTRVTVRYSGISFGAQPGAYYVTAEEIEIGE